MLQPPPHSRASIPSPLKTQIPHLSAAQVAALPYPPDHFPGARDVTTSYGSMRVYEWGKEDGRKIMLVHGDATCAPVWSRIAETLVERGCRVIVFGTLLNFMAVSLTDEIRLSNVLTICLQIFGDAGTRTRLSCRLMVECSLFSFCSRLLHRLCLGALRLSASSASLLVAG